MLIPSVYSKFNPSTFIFAGLAAAVSLGVAVLTTQVPSNAIVLGIVTAPILAAAVFLKPELGLVVLVFLVYTRTSDVFVQLGGPSLVQLYVLFLLGVILARWLLYSERIGGWQRPILFMGAYGLMGFASFLYAAEPERVQSGLVELLKDAIIIFVVVALIRQPLSLRRVVWALLAAGIFMGTITTYQQITGTFDNNYWGYAQADIGNIVGRVHDYRISGPVGLGPNAYAQFLLFLVPLALDRLWNEEKTPLRVLAGWALTVCILSIIFTFSRGVFIGLAAVVVLMLVWHPPRPAAVLVTIALAAMLLPYIPEQYSERLTTLVYLLPEGEVDAREEVSFRGRMSENIAGIQMFAEHPIVGVGLDNFKYYYQDYSRQLGLDNRRTERSAHNFYLEVAAEMGLFGLIWFFALQWVTLRGLGQARAIFESLGMKSYADLSIAFSVAIVGFLVTSVVRHMAHPRYIWLLYGIALSIPHIAKQAQVAAAAKGHAGNRLAGGVDA